MIPEHKEPVRHNPDAELRLGIASWAEGDSTIKSIKYTWFDKRGHACRGGEVPIEAIEQMVSFAKRKRYI